MKQLKSGELKEEKKGGMRFRVVTGENNLQALSENINRMLLEENEPTKELSQAPGSDKTKRQDNNFLRRVTLSLTETY